LPFMQTARCYYLALMRAFDVFKCPVRSLGELLLVRFVIRGEPYPDPTNRAEWCVVAFLLWVRLFRCCEVPSLSDARLMLVLYHCH
jgi:hypothetical protein